MRLVILFILIIFSTFIVCYDDSSSSESEDGGPDPKEVEQTLVRALELHRQSMAEGVRRSSRLQTSPQDKSARALLASFGRSSGQSSSSQLDSDLPITESDNIIKDPDYVPEKPGRSYDDHNIESKKNILKLKAQGLTESQIQKQYAWYNRKKLPKIRADVERGYNLNEAYRMIHERVYNRFMESRSKGLSVRGHNICRWAILEARKLNQPNFVASASWLARFKTKYRIRSRKVTKTISISHFDNRRGDLIKIEEFRDTFGNWSQFFRRKLILNVDQTGFNLEPSTDRTLSNKGERDTILLAGSMNKQTHSYTSQPMISRSGQTVGRLALCLQEVGGKFGPRIEQKVRQLEASYRNIKLYSSKSGKMTSELMADWTRDVLLPALEVQRNISAEDDFENVQTFDSTHLQQAGASGIQEEDNVCSNEVQEAASCSRLTWPKSVYCGNQARHRADARCHNTPSSLILIDSWSGNKPISTIGRPYGVKSMTVPERTTSEVQPLDVGFMRQYKIFVNRIVSQARFDGLIKDLTSRDGIINMHSLIWDQFASPAYREMLTWCWHKTDPRYGESEGEIAGELPLMVRANQFAFNETSCQVETCENDPFIRCSHCGKVYCLRHFLERLCFHHEQSEEAAPIDREEALRMLGDIDDDVDDEIMQMDDEEAAEIEAMESSFVNQ